jgi:hypothetical protein
MTMRLYHMQIFDDLIEGTSSAWYSGAEYNDVLGSADYIVVSAVVTGLGGSPTLTVSSEDSGDALHWIPAPTAEINGVTLTANDTVYSGVVFGQGGILLSLVRFKITLGGTTPKCRLKLYATGRVRGRTGMSMRQAGQIAQNPPGLR